MSLGEANLVSFNAAISACEKGGQFQAAWRLLSSMAAARIKPTVVSYSLAQSESIQRIGPFCGFQSRGMTPKRSLGGFQPSGPLAFSCFFSCLVGKSMSPTKRSSLLGGDLKTDLPTIFFVFLNKVNLFTGFPGREVEKEISRSGYRFIHPFGIAPLVVTCRNCGPLNLTFSPFWYPFDLFHPF